MDKIEELIKKLQDAKEELAKASANPALEPKEVKIKELQGKIDAGTYKVPAAKIADKMVDKKVLKMEDLMCGENGQWMEKAMYFGGEHSSVNQNGEKRGSAGKQANFPHYDYDTSAPHEDNVKQAKAHFDKHKHSFKSDGHFNRYLNEQKAKAEHEERK